MGKRLYRKIDFNFPSSKYFILKREYDPNRNTPINLVKCLNTGNFSYILGQENLKKGLIKIKLPSLEERYVPMDCKGSVGPITNTFRHIKKLKKAGNSRWLGKRPKVRGVAMNPIDHPHGGGEGKTSGGRPSVTPWGFITIGKKNSFKT